jgi:enolase
MGGVANSARNRETVGWGLLQLKVGSAGAMMSKTGRLQGVADEGGFWPAFESNEAALDALVSAIERAGSTPGDDVSISLDIASSEF